MQLGLCKGIVAAGSALLSGRLRQAGQGEADNGTDQCQTNRNEGEQYHQLETNHQSWCSNEMKNADTCSTCLLLDVIRSLGRYFHLP